MIAFIEKLKVKGWCQDWWRFQYIYNTVYLFNQIYLNCFCDELCAYDVTRKPFESNYDIFTDETEERNEITCDQNEKCTDKFFQIDSRLVVERWRIFLQLLPGHVQTMIGISVILYFLLNPKVNQSGLIQFHESVNRTINNQLTPKFNEFRYNTTLWWIIWCRGSYS
jgi:hypothetical protein